MHILLLEKIYITAWSYTYQLIYFFFLWNVTQGCCISACFLFTGNEAMKMEMEKEFNQPQLYLLCLYIPWFIYTVVLYTFFYYNYTVILFEFVTVYCYLLFKKILYCMSYHRTIIINLNLFIDVLKLYLLIQLLFWEIL